MSRLLLLILVMGFSLACGKNERPKDLIPELKMERVIWDLVQADEFITNFVLKDSAKVNVNAERYKLYEQVLTLHKISKDQFQTSYDYYASRPGESKVLFDSLAARASRRMQEAYKASPLKPE